MMTWFTPCSWPPEGGTPGNSRWRCAARFSKSWPDFRPRKCHFPHPFSVQISKIHTNFQTWSISACSRLSDSGEGSPSSSRFIFVFALSQFSGPKYLGAWNSLRLIRQKLCHHYQIRAQTKNSSHAFLICVFLFLSYSFGIETINSFIHVRSRSSLESRLKWAKCFQTKNAQRPYLLRRTYLYGLYKGVLPRSWPLSWLLADRDQV